MRWNGGDARLALGLGPCGGLHHRDRVFDLLPSSSQTVRCSRQPAQPSDVRVATGQARPERASRPPTPAWREAVWESLPGRRPAGPNSRPSWAAVQIFSSPRQVEPAWGEEVPGETSPIGAPRQVRRPTPPSDLNSSLSRGVMRVARRRKGRPASTLTPTVRHACRIRHDS